MRALMIALLLVTSCSKRGSSSDTPDANSEDLVEKVSEETKEKDSPPPSIINKDSSDSGDSSSTTTDSSTSSSSGGSGEATNNSGGGASPGATPTPAPQTPPAPASNPALELAEGVFWDSFLDGRYSDIPTLVANYEQLLATQAQNPVVHARLGFLKIWEYQERYRKDSFDQTIFANLGECTGRFRAALQLAPDNPVYKGFAAACLAAEGGLDIAVNGDFAKLTDAMAEGLDAIRAYPHFNFFTIGYGLSSLPSTDSNFQIGLEFMFRNLDVCMGRPFGTVSRSAPIFSPYLVVDPNGIGRVCLNTTKAPYNYEGFFMNLGDMLVKANRLVEAKWAYTIATQSPTFDDWPMKAALLANLDNVDGVIAGNIAPNASLVTAFNAPVDPLVEPNYPTIVFHSENSCAVCHKSVD